MPHTYDQAGRVVKDRGLGLSWGARLYDATHPGEAQAIDEAIGAPPRSVGRIVLENTLSLTPAGVLWTQAGETFDAGSEFMDAAGDRAANLYEGVSDAVAGAARLVPWIAAGFVAIALIQAMQYLPKPKRGRA